MKNEAVHFTVEKPDERFVLVYDRGQCVAVLDRHEFIFELLHGERPTAPTEYSLPHYYHGSTLRGARFTTCWWLSERPPFLPSSQKCKVTFDEEPGESWSFRVEEIYAGEDQGEGVHECTLRLGEEGYVAQCRASLRLKRAASAEFANTLAYGVGEAWPQRKAFTHTLWQSHDAQVLSLPHNPLHPILPGAQASNGQRDIPNGGFLGFFAARTPAWIVEITESSTPVYSSTCDNAYDEHLQCAAPEHPSPDGFYHSQVRYRLRQLPVAEADEVLARAVFIEPFPYEQSKDFNWQLPGFTPGVTDSQAQVVVGQAFCGLCWPTEDSVCRQRGVFLETDNDSSATILRLQNEGDEVLELLPRGPSIVLDSSKRYRFQARVKTEAKAGTTAYLMARQIFYSLAKVEQRDESERLKSTQDWTTLAVDITPVAHNPYLVVSLHLDGEGTAWFDNITLTEL
jgi:hypothetical protein